MNQKGLCPYDANLADTEGKHPKPQTETHTCNSTPSLGSPHHCGAEVQRKADERQIDQTEGL